MDLILSEGAVKAKHISDAVISRVRNAIGQSLG